MFCCGTLLELCLCVCVVCGGCAMLCVVEWRLEEAGALAVAAAERARA